MWKRPVARCGAGPGRLALAQLDQVAHRRPDDRVVERRRAGEVGDAQVDAADVQAVGGRALRLRERGLLGPGVLADDVLGDAAQVGVQVAAEDVAQQRAQVAGQLGGQRIDLGVDLQAADERALQRDRCGPRAR